MHYPDLGARSRNAEEKEQRREQILEAALDVFAEKGYERTVINDIARAAQLSRSLIYFYFRDKEDLHAALHEQSLRLLGKRFRNAANSEVCGRDQAAAIGRAYVDFAMAEPARFAILARAETQRELEHHIIEAKRDSVWRPIIGAIEQGISDGSIVCDHDQIDLLALSLWSFTHGLIQIRADKGKVLSAVFSRNPEELIEFGLDFLSAGLQARGLEC